MRKTVAILGIGLASLALVASCSKGSTTTSMPIAVGDFSDFTMNAKANFYYNYPKASFSESIEGITNDLLFDSQSIIPPCLISKPSKTPTRNGYDFTGWYTDKDASAIFDFASTKVTESTFLYAGWERTGGDEYMEPVYTPKESIDDSLESNIEMTGVLNVAPIEGVYYLTNGAINRLAKNPNDVAFALNYKKKTGSTVKSATYDSSLKQISVVSVNSSNEENLTLQIAENTSSSLTLTNSTYEAKAKAYESSDAEASNYHIMLAGSSSIEFWTGYENDLSPIVAYNHGIGGTTSKEWATSLFERLVAPYSPKAVCYYVGINDLTGGGTVENVSADIESLLTLTHDRLPYTHIFFIFVNVLPGYYLGYSDSIKTLNGRIASFIEDKDWIEGVKAGDALLKEDGTSDASYFRLDNLHMSEYGYEKWAAVIRKSLEEWMGK